MHKLLQIRQNGGFVRWSFCPSFLDGEFFTKLEGILSFQTAIGHFVLLPNRHFGGLISCRWCLPFWRTPDFRIFWASALCADPMLIILQKVSNVFFSNLDNQSLLSPFWVVLRNRAILSWFIRVIDGLCSI